MGHFWPILGKNMELKFKVNKDSILKDYLRDECGVSRTLGRKIKLYGKIYINNQEVKNHFPVKIDDEIRIIIPENVKENIKKVEKEIDILYEDDFLLIVNKEYDLAIQPSSKHQDDNLVARVLAYYESINISANCHILTRLDYATSGIVIIAKSPYIQNSLASKKITKKYMAKTSNKLPDNVGRICLPITRDLSSNIKRKVSNDGKNAITNYKLIAVENDTYTYELELLTGRTHQIRVHLSHLGCSIIGDKLYVGKEAPRLFLHCYIVELNHPITNEIIKVISKPNW